MNVQRHLDLGKMRREASIVKRKTRVPRFAKPEIPETEPVA